MRGRWKSEALSCETRREGPVVALRKLQRPKTPAPATAGESPSEQSFSGVIAQPASAAIERAKRRDPDALDGFFRRGVY